MATKLIMPKNGMDMKEGLLLKWLKKEGDAVRKDEPVMEIETDKITMESESPVDGVLLKRLFEEGTTVPVLATVAWIGAPGEKIPEEEPAVLEETKANPPEPERKEMPKETPEKKPAGSVDEKYDFDVAVIGGGPAGYVAAIRAAGLGARTVLFEKDTVGGTCLNRGCIPTKTLVKTAQYIHEIRKAPLRGIVLKGGGETSVDMKRVIAFKDEVVRTLTNGVAGLLKANKVTVVSGEALLSGEHSVSCSGREYTSASVIICTGSEPMNVPIEGIDHPRVVTSTGLLKLTELPKRLCIIGGGVIGVEFASAFREFGSLVTIVEMLPRLVAPFDREISKETERLLSGQGVDIMTGVRVEKILDRGGRPVIVTAKGETECDIVLSAIGRRADLAALGALKDRIETDRGFVTVDDTMRTNIPHIFAAGDINGLNQLAHAAFRMGETAAENAVTGGTKRCDLRFVPSALYMVTEAAGIGLTEEEAEKKYPGGILTGRFNMSANGRSIASGETEGFVKVIAEKRFGEILGVHIVSATASEMITEAAALMQMEITVHEVSGDIIHPHPSFSEAFAEACADVLGISIHKPPHRGK